MRLVVVCDVRDGEWCRRVCRRGCGSGFDNGHHFLNSFLYVLLVKSSNGECRFAIIFGISLVEFSPCTGVLSDVV